MTEEMSGSGVSVKRSGWKRVFGPVALAVLLPVILLSSDGGGQEDRPWEHVPEPTAHTDHAPLMAGTFETGPEVTRRCLGCHEEEGREVLETSHWRWEGEPTEVAGRPEPVRMGKRNVINNFCIAVQSNWRGCTSCHVGYGWEDDSFDFTNAERVDCLVCHEQTGQYAKGPGGYPAEGVDLGEAARSVAVPSRDNCGGCHFRGGGGDAVKHGDLDASLANPRARVDVHMGVHDLVCTDCHRTEDHDMRGRALSVSLTRENQVLCTDCHMEEPHEDTRLNNHVASVACETCHIPQVAIRTATKTHWDWSEAGQDRPEDTYEYLKKKGSFEYERELVPEYLWFNGGGEHRYLLGDPIDRSGPTELNPPAGGIDDPEAKIWPFKVHRAVQVYDVRYDHLLVPKTVGEGGYWEGFDWDQAVRLGAEAAGLEYSGEYGFTNTIMYWPLSHMVQSSENALQCPACHAADGRMDWQALGYPGDPAGWGSRDLRPTAAGGSRGGER